ncbi:MAG TPA: peptidase, partial [Noviherbaspirillum sp.]
MKLRQATAALTVAGILVTSAAGAAGWSPREWFARQDSAPPAAAAVAPATGPVAPATAPNYRAIVERFGPAVVGINTEGAMKTAARGDNDDDPFSQFFRGMPGRGGQAPVPVRGQGSGFIV